MFQKSAYCTCAVLIAAQFFVKRALCFKVTLQKKCVISGNIAGGNA
ncbi:MAG: hypothetical protein JWQ40_1252 [Segetibacter sp.]|nr:hypothetical protein [Segetibacter sp.]